MAFRSHVLVCAGTGCVSCGSFDLGAALEREIASRGLADEIQVVRTGCQGFCAEGPVLVVQPDEVFYCGLKTSDVATLVEEHLLKGRPVRKLMYTPPSAPAPVPKLSQIPFFAKQKLVVLRNRGLVDPERIDDYIARDGYEALA
nr:NAD(P)H-dependent oxidoreductase subunit E [Vicinamibacterales bacterium]